MKIISTALAFVLALFTSSVFAHAIWIESSPSGIKGKQQIVKIYYGEYEHAQIEKISDWYADLNQLEVYIVLPDQSRTKISLTNKGEYLGGSFVPATEGTYTIYTSHIAKELWEEKRFQFNSSVVVQVGKNQNSSAIASPYQLATSAAAYSKASTITVTLSKQGNVLADKEITIMAPDGWVRKIKTDTKGNAVFKASITGKYIIEFGENVEETGKWNDKPYKETWQTVTTSVSIK